MQGFNLKAAEHNFIRKWQLVTSKYTHNGKNKDMVSGVGDCFDQKYHNQRTRKNCFKVICDQSEMDLWRNICKKHHFGYLCIKREKNEMLEDKKCINIYKCQSQMSIICQKRCKVEDVHHSKRDKNVIHHPIKKTTWNNQTNRHTTKTSTPFIFIVILSISSKPTLSIAIVYTAVLLRDTLQLLHGGKSCICVSLYSELLLFSHMLFPRRPRS